MKFHRNPFRKLAAGIFLLAGIAAANPLSPALANAAEPKPEDRYQLSERNEEAPFCYLAGGRREWPISTGTLLPAGQLTLSARSDDGTELASAAAGETLSVDGLEISLTPQGRLLVASKHTTDDISLLLEIRHETAGSETISQTLEVRVAPPERPLSYIADFGDDVISIYGAGNNRYRTIDKNGLDQYFRRLQAQGISRLVVWLSPFSYVADPNNFSDQDWQRYEGQARAILDSGVLNESIAARSGYSPWAYIQQMMALRLMPDFGTMLSDSASDHGILMTASFRPFEAALTKYYVVPAFDEHGNFLWNFQPHASPAVNYHTEEIGFAHYREILRRMDRSAFGDISAIELQGVENAAELVQGGSEISVRAAGFPPLASESFVLVRDVKGPGFSLRRWAEIRDVAEARLPQLEGIRYKAEDGVLSLTNVPQLPEGTRYLRLSQAPDSATDVSVSSIRPALLRAAAGNLLGGENVYFAFDEEDATPEPTRVSGIPPGGSYHTEFQAGEASLKKLLEGPETVTLAGKQLVISVGADFSIEMMDFTQPAARQFALKQLRTLLSYPAFDEIILNTRSHTQLAGYLGDDGKSVRAIAEMQRAGVKGYHHIGLDEAYAPRNAVSDPLILKLTGEGAGNADVQRITTPQPGEWSAITCETAEPYPWRFTRNKLVAQGVRQLMLDLREEFPETRIRSMIPPSAACVARVREHLDQMIGVNGKPFGRDFYPRLRCGSNHIANIGEGMAMVDLSGTDIEPVILGSGATRQEMSTFQMFVGECVADLASNRGSTFRGPRSYFYEGQFTLRAKDTEAARKNREDIICHLLNQKGEIGEVLLYEAANWAYYLPLDDPELCGHHFLEKCVGEGQ